MRKLALPLMLAMLLAIGVFSLHTTKAGNAILANAGNTLVPAQRKRALLVGISDYCPADAKPADCAPGGRYWWNLNSAPDVEALKSALMKDFGFQASDIKTLTSKEETTHKNIVDTFKSFLIKDTNSGDIVYFHYSGHGGQVPDDTLHGPNPIVGDELDGLDETLIPSDYKSQEDGSNNIRDDEIGMLLSDLKDKHPDSITMTMDSCFSGSNTRGGEHLVRGSSWTGPVPKVDKAKAVEKSASGLLTRGAATQLGYVIMSATNDRQVAGETNCDGKEMGLFTCALVTAFNGASENTTYRDVFEKVNDQVVRSTRNQNPQLEGARDQRVMKLGAAPPQPYVTVETTGSRTILQAGRLQGMTVGSRFDIHPKGADPKDTQRIAQAEITRIDLTTSILSLTSSGVPPTPDDLQLSRAVETLHNFGDQRLRVAANDLGQSANGTAALKTITDMKLVNAALKPTEAPQVRICHGVCKNELPGDSAHAVGNGFTLMREDGSIIKRLPDDASLGEGIRRSLEGEARWRYVKEVLTNDDRHINLKFRLVPVEMNPNKCQANDPDCNPTSDKATPEFVEGGRMVLHDEDLVQIEFLNTGSLPVYVTVLDLRSDGTIGPLWPNPEVPFGNAEENLIKVSGDKKWQRLPWQFTIKITEPFGPEMFKAIATRNPADFSALVDPPTAARSIRGGMRGQERGAAEAKTEIGQLLLSAAGPQLTRGDLPFMNLGSIAVSPMNWATTEITFEARPKQ
ncbi:MAG: hypothetical protein JWM21_4215 [Acidobacteria bacterium]|nr:hypothetical protein [Acidobacteriota bacterium]